MLAVKTTHDFVIKVFIRIEPSGDVNFCILKDILKVFSPFGKYSENGFMLGCEGLVNEVLLTEHLHEAWYLLPNSIRLILSHGLHPFFCLRHHIHERTAGTLIIDFGFLAVDLDKLLLAGDFFSLIVVIECF